MAKRVVSNEAQKQAVLEELWLTYYNDTLLKHGLITENEHRAMLLKINARTEAKLNGRK